MQPTDEENEEGVVLVAPSPEAEAAPV